MFSFLTAARFWRALATGLLSFMAVMVAGGLLVSFTLFDFSWLNNPNDAFVRVRAFLSITASFAGAIIGIAQVRSADE
ncbi:hypothetical protein J7443_17510 [Tropicibacter sp. R15_0]|uniref:hypothetical protein n=1 Tax=Tropicibacter sp. R15_0 TaxID=2821101 RepID=UPI001AD9D792|nr:hypothetical protein [Tropicibacter sp. R15_0]MBO9467045.1 hypothetical protein [Tropicibacter sp. R15_0]